jgi:hypothetical protein
MNPEAEVKRIRIRLPNQEVLLGPVDGEVLVGGDKWPKVRRK